MTIRLFGLLLVVLLTSCAVSPRSTQRNDTPEAAWEAHSQQIRLLQDWQLKGRVGVRQDQQAWHASLDWRQVGKTYKIDLISPLGNKLAHFSGSDNGVYLTTSKGQTAFAPTPEHLMTELLGFSLPLAGMRYWVKGVPEPGVPAENMVLDRSGRLSRLTQAGWEVDYQRYQPYARIFLPGKLKLSHSDTGVTLIVKEWQAL